MRRELIKLMKILEATISDIKQLTTHYRKMFEEICELEGKFINEDILNEIEKAYCEKLENQISEGSCKAWVVINGNKVVSSGAVTIVSFVPVPNDSNHNIAYFHSMYTESKFRGRKYAQKIIDKAIQYCKEIGINRVILNTSDAGKPIYEELGFTESPNSMISFINK